MDSIGGRALFGKARGRVVEEYLDKFESQVVDKEVIWINIGKEANMKIIIENLLLLRLK